MSESQPATGEYRQTEHTRVRRLPARAAYDHETVHDILDSGLLCHVGYNFDDRPFVTTTSYWRECNTVYWHGSAASRMLRQQSGGVPVCFTVSHLDGLVMARSGFHHSMNYRSVMALGQSMPVLDEEEKSRQLKLFMERLAPGRWDEVRPVTARELRLTTVMSLDLEEVVAKVRTGPPVDDDEDYDLPIWAGVVPVHRSLGKPEDDGRLQPGVKVPESIRSVQFD